MFRTERARGKQITVSPAIIEKIKFLHNNGLKDTEITANRRVSHTTINKILNNGQEKMLEQTYWELRDCVNDHCERLNYLSEAIQTTKNDEYDEEEKDIVELMVCTTHKMTNLIKRYKSKIQSLESELSRCQEQNLTELEAEVIKMMRQNKRDEV